MDIAQSLRDRPFSFLTKLIRELLNSLGHLTYKPQTVRWALTKPGTWNIPEHPGTFWNIPEHPGTGQIITK